MGFHLPSIDFEKLIDEVVSMFMSDCGGLSLKEYTLNAFSKCYNHELNDSEFDIVYYAMMDLGLTDKMLLSSI